MRRSVKSPKRLIGVLFFALYYVYMIGPAMWTQSRNGFPTPQFDLAFPPMEVIDGVVFGAFCLFSIFLFLGMLSFRAGFKPADVEVLFPTPVSPKLVLLFRILRDTLVTVIMPLILTLVFYRPASASWVAMFKNVPHPESAGQVMRTGFAAWLLLSFVSVTTGHAISLYIHRPGKKFDRLRKQLGWGTLLAFLAIIAYTAIDAQSWVGFGSYLEFASTTVMRGSFFLASAATVMTLAPLHGSWLQGILGFGTLATIAAAGIASALGQSGWLYDQVAARTSSYDESKEMRRAGDTYGVIAAYARKGKLKASKTYAWVHRLNWVGPRALLWKELVLQLRASKFGLMFVALFGLALGLLPLLLPARDFRFLPYFILIMQASVVFMVTSVTAQSGFLEMLRRVDLQKPLPFKPSTTVAYEVYSKAIVGPAVGLISSITVVIARPSMWPGALGAALLMPTFSLLISGLFLVLTLWFPDVDDPTQRSFRGLVTMLGIGLFSFPTVIVILVCGLLHVPLPVSCLLAGAMNAGLFVVVTSIAGRAYESFSPSE